MILINEASLRKMTDFENAAKDEIIEILGSQGYKTYAKLLSKLDVKLIDKKHENSTIAYLDTRTATIYLNRNLNTSQISTIVRHEILHEYLTHMIRAEAFMSKDPKYKNLPHDLVNIAADYEISNLGYTDKDKDAARAIRLDKQTLRGLVTEDDHPDWINKSFEEMLELLTKEDSSKIKQMQQTIDLGIESPEDLAQDIDDIEQQASDISDNQQEQGNGSSQEKQTADSIENSAKSLGKANDKMVDKAQEKPFQSPREQQTQEEIQERVKQLKQALSELKKDIFDETEKVKHDSDMAGELERRAAEIAKYKNLPSVKFAESLNNFIKTQIGRVKGKSWAKINKNTIYSGTINKGISRSATNLIPVINVYFDRSGSFNGYPEKTKSAEKALATLSNYARRGQIKINLYYVSDKVYNNRQEAESKGWGADGVSIIEHIEATKPDNVIILTDDDASVTPGDPTTKVPGAVWLLYYENRADNLDNHIRGVQLNRIFDMEI